MELVHLLELSLLYQRGCLHAVVGLEVVVLPLLRIRHPTVLRRTRLLHADLLVLLLHVRDRLLVVVDLERRLEFELRYVAALREVVRLVRDLDRRLLLNLVKVVVC